MSDLRGRFATLDSIPAPDLWADVERPVDALSSAHRTERLVAGRPHWGVPHGSAAGPARFMDRRSLLVVAAALLLIAGLVGAALVGSGLMRLATVLPSPSPLPSPSLVTTPSPNPTEGAAWIATGRMRFERLNGSAVLLQDGRVLAVGGQDNSAEIYDPIDGTWTTTGPMVVAHRGGQTATVLLDGRVLVAGGKRPDPAVTGSSVPYPHADAELLDAATGTWTATSPMTIARSSHAAVLLGNGTVLVVGGNKENFSATRTSETFDPSTGTWSRTGTVAILAATATLLPDGSAIAIGQDRSGQPAAELYDPVSRQWAPTTDPPTPGCGRLLALASGALAICGNAVGHGTAAFYDPSARTWTMGQLTDALLDPVRTATVLADGRVVLSTGGAGVIYDPSHGTWRGAGLPTPEANPGAFARVTIGDSGSRFQVDLAVLLPDRRVLMLIGQDALLYDARRAP